MARLLVTRAYEAQPVQVDAVRPEEPIRIVVEPDEQGEYLYEWSLPEGTATDARLEGPNAIVYFESVPPGKREVAVTLYREDAGERVAVDTGRVTLDILRPMMRSVSLFRSGLSDITGADGGAEREDGDGQPLQPGQFIPVTLGRTATPPTPDVALWMTIRRGSRSLSFRAYREAMDRLLCNIEPAESEGRARTDRAVTELLSLSRRRFLPFNDTDAYRFLKVATEAYVLANVGVMYIERPDGTRGVGQFSQAEIDEAIGRLGLTGGALSNSRLQSYLVSLNTADDGRGPIQTLPYLALVRDKLRDEGIKRSLFVGMENDGVVPIGLPEECEGILAERLTAPLLLELIWSYWQEEGMLVQTMNAIGRRFQNIRGPGERDPLANFETDPLRPLNNLLWGYVQDEQHRLSVLRRAYEYDHHYGISLVGRAVGALRPADSRSKFLEGFHNLLYMATIFFQADDDTTVIADGFPLLNALREVHLELSRGAHNQFGDLPSTARQEMLMQQWLLARGEFREFLPTRIMVAYPEPWMDRVDAMKSLQGWTDTSVMHFHNLAVFGEQILLAIRYGAWTDPNVQRDWAANWARFWRPEIQGYIHAYRAVTGIDLSAEVTDSQREGERYLQPAVHLSRQLDTQRRGSLPAPPAALPAPGAKAGQKTANR